MTAEEFLKHVSPNDEFGIRADLKAAKIEKHVIDIMERYAALRIQDVVGRSEQLPLCGCDPKDCDNYHSQKGICYYCTE